MKNNIFILVSLLVFTSYGKLFADGYGQAGCGLGSLVFGSKQGFSQVFAATTNGTSGSQTFGITSGTSNCGKSIFASIEQQKDYMYANFSTIKKQSAKGHGSELDGFASILGCSKVKSEFTHTLQSHFNAVFNSKNPEAVLNNVKEEIKNNNILRDNCTYSQS